MATQIVIDTSAVVAVTMNEPDAPAILASTKGVELFSPSSLPWEFGNAVSAMLKRRRIDRAQAIGVLGVFARIPVELIDVPVERAIALSADLGIYAYDAYMICCAERVAGPLLTLDAGLKAAARRAGIATLEVTP